MLDAFENKNFLINFTINDKDEYANLTYNDCANYSVYDLFGNVINELENINIEITDENRTIVVIDIPAEANFIPEGSAFTNRVVVFNYNLNGVQHSIRKTYRVVPFIPYMTNEHDVRSLLGLPDTILEDSMIDVYVGYLKSKAIVSNLDEILTSGTIKSTLANRMIAIKTALSLRTSIPLLTPKIETESVVSQTRYTFSLDDFNKLFDALEEELDNITAEIIEEDVLSYTDTMFVVGSRTDEFTGA